LDAPSVGIAQAERVINDFYEMSNDRKLVNRLGMKEQPTYRTDKLLFFNSLASSCGFEDAQLPFEVSYPPSPPVKEYMGLNFELPAEFCLPVEDREASTADTHMARFQFSSTEEEGDEDATAHDMAQFLEGIEFDNDDVPVHGEQFTPRDETETEEEIITRLHEDSQGFAEEDLEPVAFEKFEQEVASSLPRIVDRESTMEAWMRLTQQRPIVPFKSPRLPLTELDKAEHALFDELQVNYSRHSAYLGGVRGYKRFEAEWNTEVANRYRDKLTTLDDAGDGDAKPLVHRKTYLHLREHYDNLQSQTRTASLAGTSDGEINCLHFQLRDSRREMAPHQEAHECQPIVYNYRNCPAPQLGNPTTLNTNITAHAFTYNQQHNNGGVPFYYNVPQQNSTALSTINGFKGGTYCCRCGWRKRDHIGGCKFGRECVGNVGRDE